MWVSYTAAGILTLALGMHLARKPRVEKVTQFYEDTRKVYELNREIERLKIDLFHTRKFYMHQNERIIEERPDGTRIQIVREFVEKEQEATISSTTETRDISRELEQVDKRTETKTAEKVEPENNSRGWPRLGLDLGIAGDIDLQTLKPSIRLDGHYELWGRFGPTVGVSFSPTFTELRSISVGVRINL